MDTLTELNPEQFEAVTHVGSHQLVVAGAGSGKTRVITYRVAWLVQELGIDPRSIVAVTFTNKAAAEMRERIQSLLRVEPLSAFVGTFHRFSLVLLRRYGDRIGVDRGFTIFDRDDQISTVKKSLAEEGLAESSFPPRAVLSAISSAKNRLLGPEAFAAEARGFFDERVARVYRTYQGLLVRSSAMDFDDMLRLSVKLLESDASIRGRLQEQIHYLLVDEFQDTNHAQMSLVRALIGDEANLTAVGDEDQGIYGWRGADLDNILRFEKAFPGAVVRKLERNYRSTQNILSAAGAVVEHNEGRRPKKLWTESGDGELIELYKGRDEQDEARWIANTLSQLQTDVPYERMAVLVRTNAQTRAIEERFLKETIPYVLVGGVRFYERAEIKDLVAYLRVLRNPREELSLLRILNRPPRGIGKTSREMLLRRSEEGKQPLWDVILHADPGSYPQRTAKALVAFRELVLELRRHAEELPLPALLDRLLEATGYADLYRKEDAESQARLENIREFLTAAQEFTEEAAEEGELDALTGFLDHASLVADIDEWQAGRGVSLMTLHSAKGLEFEAVVLAGLEDGLLPHFNAKGTLSDIEEERRLLYVGMTRAEKRLFLSTCRRRRIAGRYQDQMESQFLGEIPAELTTSTSSPELFSNARSDGVFSFFDRPRRRAPVVEAAAATGSSPRELARGRRVRHPTLGDGVVVQLEGSGETSKLTVYFDRVGKRKLIARYAALEVL